VPSIDKIRAAIEWEPTFSLDQTLDAVIAYFRQSPGASAA
jgi:nucleoside-diphosphate-sugar epimerase